MLLLGLLLLVATGAFTVALIAENSTGTPDYTVTLFDQHIATMNSVAVFVAGLALALIFALALWMTMLGAGVAHRRRVALRDAQAEARSEAAKAKQATAEAHQATAERDAMRDRLTETPLPTREDTAPTTEAAPAGAAPATTTRPARHTRKDMMYRFRHMFGH